MPKRTMHTPVSLAWLTPLWVVLALINPALLVVVAGAIWFIVRRTNRLHAERVEAAIADRRAQFGSWA